MSYCVMNKQNGCVECIYEEYDKAEIMARNLSNYYNGRYTFAITKDSRYQRPTEQQMYRINQIEKFYNIQFNGITRNAATKFLNEYITAAKALDNK